MTESAPRKPLSRLLDVLRELEWSAERTGVPRHHAEGPPVFPSCPSCHQVTNDDQTRMHFPSHHLGHARSCDLAWAIERVQSLQKSLEGLTGWQNVGGAKAT